MQSFRVIPYYTGQETLEAVLKHPASLKMLWIEILLNNTFPWENYLDHREVRLSHEKACRWYGHFKTMVDAYAGPPSLTADRGKIDLREYRKFLEALNFVAD